MLRWWQLGCEKIVINFKRFLQYCIGEQTIVQNAEEIFEVSDPFFCQYIEEFISVDLIEQENTTSK